MGIFMGTQRPTHIHTHHGSVPTYVGMGMCVGWWVFLFPMGLPTTATTTTIYHDNTITTTMLTTAMITTVLMTSIICMSTTMTAMLMMITIATSQPRPYLQWQQPQTKLKPHHADIRSIMMNTRQPPSPLLLCWQGCPHVKTPLNINYNHSADSNANLKWWQSQYYHDHEVNSYHHHHHADEKYLNHTSAYTGNWNDTHGPGSLFWLQQLSPPHLHLMPNSTTATTPTTHDKSANSHHYCHHCPCHGLPLPSPCHVQCYVLEMHLMNIWVLNFCTTVK